MSCAKPLLVVVMLGGSVSTALAIDATTEREIISTLDQGKCPAQKIDDRGLPDYGPCNTGHLMQDERCMSHQEYIANQIAKYNKRYEDCRKNDSAGRSFGPGTARVGQPNERSQAVGNRTDSSTPKTDLQRRLEKAKPDAERAEAINKKEEQKIRAMEEKYNSDHADEIAAERAALEKAGEQQAAIQQCDAAHEQWGMNCTKIDAPYQRNYCMRSAKASMARCVASALGDEKGLEAARRLQQEAEMQLGRDVQDEQRRRNEEQAIKGIMLGIAQGLAQGLSQSRPTYNPPPRTIITPMAPPSSPAPSLSDPTTSHSERGHM
jgi:hypothetical protein